MAQAGQRFDLSPFYNLTLDTELSVTDLGTRDKILLLPGNIILLAIPMNTTSLVAYYLTMHILHILLCSAKHFSYFSSYFPPFLPSHRRHIWLTPHIQELSTALEDGFAGGI